MSVTTSVTTLDGPAGAAPVGTGAALPAVSIVVCTRNRAASLARTLQSMLLLDTTGLAALEVVVVDNGSTDGTAQVVADAAARASFPVVCVHEARPGASRARNAAIARSVHPVILVTDDDCLVAPDWARVAAGLFADELCQVVGGRVELANPDHLPLSVKTSLVRERFTRGMMLFGFMHGANMAFGRPVVDRIGAFDLRLGPGTPLQGGEDCEFIFRASQAGIPVTYEPSLVVSHDHGRSGADENYRMTRSYAVGAGAIAAKHLLRGRPDLLKMVLWEFRGSVRSWRHDRRTWPMLRARLGIVAGAARFVLHSSWRRAA